MSIIYFTETREELEAFLNKTPGRGARLRKLKRQTNTPNVIAKDTKKMKHGFVKKAMKTAKTSQVIILEFITRYFSVLDFK